MNADQVKTVAVSAAVVVVGVLLWRAAGAVKGAASAVGDAVNPTSDQNLAARGVNAVGAAISGDKDWTLGGWLASVTGADRDADIQAMLKGPTPTASYDETERLARRYPAPANPWNAAGLYSSSPWML